MGILILLLTVPAVSVCIGQRGRLPDSVSTAVDDIPAQKKYTDTVVTDTVVVGKVQDEGAITDSIVTLNDTAIREPDRLRAVPDSVIYRQQREKEFAYANDPSYWKAEPKPEVKYGFWMWLARLLASKGFHYFIYFLLGGILLFAIYKIIAENNLRMFYGRPVKQLSKGGTENEELQGEDLEEALRKALEGGQHRLAVRYLYLKTLGLLEEKGWIQYQIKATGQDYLLQMRGHALERDFVLLHSAYERVWYGEFPIDQSLFDKLHEYFQNFFKTAGQASRI